MEIKHEETGRFDFSAEQLKNYEKNKKAREEERKKKRRETER